MTYGEIYNQALQKLCLYPGDVEDYRPAVEMHIKQLKEPIPNGIIIWLKNGNKIIYVADSQKEEQEPILDKIRAEIDELYSYVEFDEDLKTSFNMVRLEEVQRVIDKYKAESEKK